ncbi:MAG: DUF1015 domain-containing protein [Nitrospirae bacterium]|nr:DUF1015 domain-containing protein [Nitrospirota bacterium]
MAEIIPFKGILYNPKKVDAGDVTAPPYDIVTPEFKEALYDRSPYNIVRIDFGKDIDGGNEKENRYTRASKFFNEWLKKGILVNDSKPLFYCYEATYNPPTSPFDKGGQRGIFKRGQGGAHVKKLRGLIAAVRLEELGSGKIHPHEMTYSKPKTDRLNIIRFCRANISPIFSLYSSKDGITSSILKKTVKGRTFIEASDRDDFMHRLWKINDRSLIDAIKKEFSDKHIFIADGHHRYETALEFKKEMDATSNLFPWDYVLMFLANMEDNGLTLLPTHRLIKLKKALTPNDIERLFEPHFEIKTIKSAVTTGSAVNHLLKEMKKGRHSLGMYTGNRKASYILRFRGGYSAIESPQSLKRLDVTILHRLILEKLLSVDEIDYEMNPALAEEKVNKGMYKAAFFLNPTRVEDVKKVALAGQRMPPKSTYFYPKLLTGMVIYRF